MAAELSLNAFAHPGQRVLSGSLYAAFASPNFNASEYANAILAGEPYPPAAPDNVQPTTSKALKPTYPLSSLSDPAKEDITVAISKLTVGIDDVSKQLRNVITSNHEALLVQTAGVNELEEKLQKVSEGLSEVSATQDKLRMKIRDPYNALSAHATRLTRLQCAADVLRRISRFVVVARRLESQMTELERLLMEEPSMDKEQERAEAKAAAKNSPPDRKTSEDSLNLDTESEKERAIAKAALSVAELVSLLDAVSHENETRTVNSEDQGADDGDFELVEIPLRSIRTVTVHVPTIEAARAKIMVEMENMVLKGLASLDRSLLASSLQTAHNLRVLPNLVQSLLTNLTDAVEQSIRAAFDMTRISKEVNAKEPNQPPHGLLYRSRVRTEPTNITAPQWIAALWSRLERLIEEFVDCCIKVYTLEKVLQLKKDTLTRTNFMDEAMKVLENKPSAAFWTVLARTLGKQCRDSARSSSFMQQTLSSGYPRLLRLFHDFFAKIAVHTDTSYTHEKQSPETILILRALSVFEQSYLQRSVNRLNETVGQSLAGGARSPPAMSEGINISRTATNELDAARFDPLLIRSVAENVKTSLELLLTRLEPLIVRDRWATSLLGPTSTPQQTQNAQVATCLYHCHVRLSALEGEHREDILAILLPTIKDIQGAYEQIVDPLLGSIRRELALIIGKMHKQDFSKGPEMSANWGGPSAYMKDLIEKLEFVKTEVLAKFNVGDASREWVTTIVKHVLRTFVLNASIANPLGEGGKLQLTTDMTELEFALGDFMSEGTAQSKRGIKLDVIGEDYRALRAMRPLLFLETNKLATVERTAELTLLVVLHHVLVRSRVLPLPHVLHGWSEAEYVRWVDEHSPEEALALIDGVLDHWEKVALRDKADIQLKAGAGPENEVEGEDYAQIAKEILARTRGSNRGGNA